jgi:hypothetical protein
MERGFPTLGGIGDPSGLPGGEPATPQIAKDYIALNQRIRRAGLYETRDSYYVGKYLLLAALLTTA